MEVKKDLIRIENIGEKTAEILILAGINNSKELGDADFNSLSYKIAKLKDEGKINSSISKDQLQKFKDSAKNGGYLYSKAITRYNSLIKRAVDEYVDLVLYKVIIVENILNFSPETYDLSFISDKIVLENTLKEYSGMSYEDSVRIESFKTQNKNTCSSLCQIISDKHELFISITDFKNIFGKDEDERACHYCGISEKHISDLIVSDQIGTKRLWQRGRNIEIDQMKPDDGYTKNNIVLSCYWCNNAKTDEFSYEEFRPIAKSIHEIWEKRGCKDITETSYLRKTGNLL